MFGVNKPQVISISHKFRTLLFLYFIRGGKVNLRIYENFFAIVNPRLSQSLSLGANCISILLNAYFHASRQLWAQ